MSMYNDETDSLRDKFRHCVLDALDAEAIKHFGNGAKGWLDDELPQLFRTIDRVLDRLDDNSP